MDDLISRQEALNIHFSDAINEDGVLYVPLRDFTNGLKALPSAQQWIPCSECVNFVDHRCIVAQHHVSEQSDCSKVFGAKRKEES